MDMSRGIARRVKVGSMVMSRHSLGISWVHGRFQAVASSGGQTVGAWTCPAVVEESRFEDALSEAVRETGFVGTRVFLVVEHRSLLFHVQETPPAKGRLLDQLLQRLVSQSRFFEERASWGRVELPAMEGRQRYLLALLPEPLVQHLSAACAANRLQLAAVVPVAAVFGAQLRQLSVGKEEVVVLAADFGESLQLLLGRGDGQVLFSRNVVLAGAQANERAAQEINRTLHYAQQQFGAVVNHLFVFGDGAFAGLKDVKIRDGLKLEQSPVAEAPFYFATRAAELSTKHPLNLVNRAENRRRHGRQLAVAAVAVLLVGTASTVLLVERTVLAREARAVAMERELDEQARTQTGVLVDQQEARHLAAFVQFVDPARHPPVPELLARYLSARLPDALRLSDLQVVRATNGWSFVIQGFVQEQPDGVLGVLERFEQELEQGIFQTRIADSTRRRVFHPASTEPAATPSRAGARDNERAFFVAGLIE